MKIPEDQTIQY